METASADQEEITIKIYPNGDREWRSGGLLHRANGPAREFTIGGVEWWEHGKLHRLDGPAVEYPDEFRCWRVDGKIHRLDGPAIEYADGDCEWFVNGCQCEFPKEFQRVAGLSDKDIILLILKYGMDT